MRGVLPLGFLLMAFGASSAAAAEDGSAATVLVMDFTSADAELGRLVTQLVAVELSARHSGAVLSSVDVARVLALEEQRQLMGCDAESCLAEIAGALGASEVVFGEVAQLDKKLLITMNLFDATSAQARGRAVVETHSRDDLPNAVRRGVSMLLPQGPSVALLATGGSLVALGVTAVIAASAVALLAAGVRSDAMSSGPEKELAGTTQVIGGVVAGAGTLGVLVGGALLGAAFIED